MYLFGKSKAMYRLEDKPFASGGEGEIYNVLNVPNRVVKVYKDSALTSCGSESKEEKLLEMVANSPSAELAFGCCV